MTTSTIITRKRLDGLTIALDRAAAESPRIGVLLRASAQDVPFAMFYAWLADNVYVEHIDLDVVVAALRAERTGRTV